MRSRSEWSGFYYDGRSAHRERVTVTVGADALQLHRSDGQTVAWPFEGVRQTQGSYSGERLRLEFGTDRVEVLFVQQDGLPEAVRQIAPGAMRGLRARQSTAKILALSLGLVALLVTGYVLAARAIVSWLTPRVPVEWEVSLGHGVVERMAPVEQRCDDTSAVAGVRGIVERLAAVAPSPYDFQVFVTRDSTVNAFAAPGGFLVVNGGLLAAAQTPEQLAGVLAHEIQHVVHRHTTRALLREAPPRLLLSALGGSVIEAAASAVVTLNSLRYMRADEAEADRDAVHMLAAAHIDPVAMVQFMRILGADDTPAPREAEYLSSHPPTTDRVAALEAMVAQARAKPEPLLEEVEWRRLRASCGIGEGQGRVARGEGSDYQ